MGELSKLGFIQAFRKIKEMKREKERKNVETSFLLASIFWLTPRIKESVVCAEVSRSARHRCAPWTVKLIGSCVRPLEMFLAELEDEKKGQSAF